MAGTALGTLLHHTNASTEHKSKNKTKKAWERGYHTNASPLHSVQCRGKVNILTADY